MTLKGAAALALGVLALVGLSGVGHAADEPVDAKKIFIKDKGTDKRQVQVQSKDVDGLGSGLVNLGEADDPTANGAALHVWSVTDDFCFILPAASWENVNGIKFKYKDANKNRAQIKEGQLKVKIKGPAPLAYTLDELTQGAVNAVFKSGSGQTWCMQSCTPTRDEPGKFLAKNCPEAGCPAEPSTCNAPVTTTTTTSTSTSTTSMTGSTTTTTLGLLAFTTAAGTTSCGPAGLTANPSAPFSGAIYSNTAGTTKIRDLGLGCLYFGGGGATQIPANQPPDAATTYLKVTGPTTLGASPGTSSDDCSQGAGPSRHCVNNNAMAACANDVSCGGQAGSCALDANCFFGPPLPVLAPPPNGALTTCVVNVIQTDAGGTFNSGTGAATINLPLSARVYITGNTTSPCPKCTPTCSYGKNAGGACTAVGTQQTSNDCPPNLAGFQAPLATSLNPLTTGTVALTSSTGNFCSPQKTAGAFGQGSARRISETGFAPGDISDLAPHDAKLVSVFCIPSTNSFAVDLVADLPGPGAIGLNGTVQLQ